MFGCILLLVWAHVAAVFFYLCVKSENLIRPMLPGRKERAHVPSGLSLHFAPALLALLLFMLAAAIVYQVARP